MLLLWLPILLASVSALPLSQVNSIPKSVTLKIFQEQTPSWVNICGGTYLYSEDRKTWSYFQISSSRIFHLSRMFLFLHKVHLKKQRVLSSTNMDLLLRNDAYGQCELYEGHLVQVIHFHYHHRCSCSHVTHPYSKYMKPV